MHLEVRAKGRAELGVIYIITIEAVNIIQLHQAQFHTTQTLKHTAIFTAHINISVLMNKKLLGIFATPRAHMALYLNDCHFQKGTLPQIQCSQAEFLR